MATYPQFCALARAAEIVGVEGSGCDAAPDARHPEACALLRREGDHADGMAEAEVALDEQARDFDGRDHAGDAIEATTMRHAVEVGPRPYGGQGRILTRELSDRVTDGVLPDLQAQVRQPRANEVMGAAFRVGEGETRDATPTVFTELGKRIDHRRQPCWISAQTAVRRGLVRPRLGGCLVGVDAHGLGAGLW